MSGLVHGVTKTYTHSLGLSCCFRQWRATSHCRFLHGYALEIKLTFESITLNTNNWVIDFGSLKSVKQWVIDTFDHKLLIAEDDPLLTQLLELRKVGLADVIVVPNVGCEAFARLVFDKVNSLLTADEAGDLFQGGVSNRPQLVQVEVREHAGNSAYVRRAGEAER